MQPIEEMSPQVMGCLCRLADPRDKDKVPLVNVQSGKGLLEDVQDPIVTAPRAPCDVDLPHIKELFIHCDPSCP